MKRSLPMLVGLISMSIFIVTFAILARAYFVNPTSDAIIYAAFISSPGFAWLWPAIKVLNICQDIHSSSCVLTQWLAIFVVGTAQAFAVPAFVVWLLFDKSRPVN